MVFYNYIEIETSYKVQKPSIEDFCSFFITPLDI